MLSEEDIRRIFCLNLNRLIDEHNVTQREVADFVGVSYPTMNHWVKGNKVPRMDKIDKLCAFFLCKRCDLMEKHEPEPSEDIEDYSPEEKDILAAYRAAPSNAKQIVRLTLEPYMPASKEEGAEAI